VPTPYNSQFQRYTCMHVSSAFSIPDASDGIMALMFTIGKLHPIIVLRMHQCPFILFFGIRMHYTRTWSIHIVFPKIISLILPLHCARTTSLDKPLPGSTVSGCFSGIHHLLTAVVLTKRNIPLIFRIRSWTRVWSVCIFLKSFFLQWLLLLITDLNLPFFGQHVLSILRLTWGWFEVSHSAMHCL
jgi:hypothetical protein